MLLLTMLQTVFCLMLCCDAAIEIHGALREIRPTEVSVHCYFATGALKGLEITHTRELFLRQVFGRSQPQRMSFTSTRLQGGNASRNFLPLGGTTKISGNLKKGVIFTMTKARCQDAGDYTCILAFSALSGRSIKNLFTSDKERLDLFPDILRFSALPRQIHFDESEEPENLKVTCATFTTVEVTWTWKFRKDRTLTDWSTFSSNLSTENIPNISNRCRNPVSSVLRIQVSKEHLGMELFCVADWEGGKKTSASFTLKELPTKKKEEKSDDFGKALSTAGWIVLTFVIIVICILMAHTVVPNFPQNVGLIPRHVRVWCRNRRRRTDQNNQAPPREHGEPEVPAEDSVAPRQPNRRRRSSQLVSVLRATGDGSGMDEAFYSSQVNALFDLDLCDSPGAESTSTSSGAVENRIDADESEEEYDDNDVEERSVKDGNSLGGADSVFKKVHSAPSIPASSSSLPQPSPVGSKLSVPESVSRNVKSDGRTGSITSDITNKSLKSKAESIAGGSGGATPGSHRSESSTRMTTGAAENGAVARPASATTVSSTVAESPQTPVERTPSGHSAKQESAKNGKKS